MSKHWLRHAAELTRRFGPAARFAARTILAVAIPGGAEVADLVDKALGWCVEGGEVLDKALDPEPATQQRLDAVFGILQADLGKLMAKVAQLEAQPAVAQRTAAAALAENGPFREAAAKLADLSRQLAQLQQTTDAVYGVVLDLKAELQRQGEDRGKLEILYQHVIALQKKYDLLEVRELRPGHSASIRNDTDRKEARKIAAAFDSLPPARRQALPALGSTVAKLAHASGDYEAAQQRFLAAAVGLTDPPARAELHFNAFRAALEARSWDDALKSLAEASRLDPDHYALFPADKYQPQRILGAGGFGVAFLCKHRELRADVVVKALTGDDLDRGHDAVLDEARMLLQLDHPNIVSLLDCGRTGAGGRPYYVMKYVPESQTLESYVKTHGPLQPPDLLPVARQMAEGLAAAHAQAIFHRDVKPSNVLVRRQAAGWQVKLIDFGLALRQAALQTATNPQTLQGTAIAGTLDYAAPEQMGKLSGFQVGPYSDVYGFAKTCCYALFQTVQPLRKHWKSVPEHLADLLENCLAEAPPERPADFAAVLRQLAPPAPKVEEVLEVATLVEPLPDPVPQPPPLPRQPPGRRDRFWAAPANVVPAEPVRAASQKVTGRVEVPAFFSGGAGYYTVYLDDEKVCAGVGLAGCNGPFESTVGSHNLRVQCLVWSNVVVTFDRPGTYLVTVRRGALWGFSATVKWIGS